MPREAIVDLPCRVKYELGAHDVRAGSRKLVNLLHAKERVALIRSRPRQDGQVIDDLRITLPVLTDSGQVQLESRVSEWETEIAYLAPLEPYCTNCPANVYRRSFGCVGGLPYPITRAVEEYALNRLAPPDRLGGALLLESLERNAIDGSKARDSRGRGNFEAFSAPTRKLPGNAFGKATLTSDELFEPLLIERGPLLPWLALNVLLWYEAITFDGNVPTTINDVLALTRMEITERSKRTKSLLGPPSPAGNAEVFRGLLKMLYVAWSRDLPVMIES